MVLLHFLHISYQEYPVWAKNLFVDARLAKWIISTYPDELSLGCSKLYEVLKEKDACLAKKERLAPSKVSDEEIAIFIDKNYDPLTSTATGLLRDLRDKDKKSCEQKRFGRIFIKHVKDHIRRGNEHGGNIIS